MTDPNPQEAMAARAERSRSPLAGAPSAPAAILMKLDDMKMQLSLEGRVAKVVYFSEADIWFEAKPLVLYLEYASTCVTQTLNRVKEKNKKNLKELLDTRGAPKMGDLSDKSPTYNELKALYVNEPGLYSLIFRSTKKQAEDFQDWVYEDVLTKLRRQGSYSIGQGDQQGELLKWLNGDLSLALQQRDEQWQQLVLARDDAWRKTCLDQRRADDEWRAEWRESLNAWRASLRTTFDDAIAAARNSGFLQIGRQAGGGGSHLRVQDELLAACRQIPADQFEMFRRSGDMLCVSTFLEETLPADQQHIIRHFMPMFSAALKGRKLQEASEMGERPWIAWKEGAWRIVYTEADRTMMLLLFQEDPWQRRLRDLLTMHPPPRNGSRAPQSGGLRGGPYSRPQPGGSSHVNAANLRAFFGAASGTPGGVA